MPNQTELYAAADNLAGLQLDYWHAAAVADNPDEQASLLETEAVLDRAVLLLVDLADSCG
jgi:hypothetical protein